MSVTVLGSVVAFIIVFCMICIPLEYKHFTMSYEIQREIVAEMPESSSVYVADIITANAELADYRASKEFWKFASLIPDSVFDIIPIGLD